MGEDIRGSAGEISAERAAPAMSALKRAKQGVLAVARAVGGFRLARESAWRQRRLLILCYHGVSLVDEHEWNPELYVSREHFRKRMALLRDGGYHVLPLGEAVARLRAGTLPARAIAITFDDGAHDFLASAVPILREFGFPATVYLTTYYCSRQWPVFDTACSYLLWKARGRSFETEGLLSGTGSRTVGDRAARQALIMELREAAARVDASTEDKDRRLRLLAQRLGIDDTEMRMRRILHLMTPAEVATLSGANVDVQLHTHRHRTPADRAAFLREIDDNRAEILRYVIAAPPATHFCYPSGIHAREFLPWLRERGVMTATTCEPGLAAPDSDPLLLPRLIDTMNLSRLEFQAWLDGVADWLPRRGT
jgi:peptidoglycan/xylan/chitin deacetylase (PgdA/CDA1 family)